MPIHRDELADDQERRHCALDLDRAREAKPQVYAMAQWAILWGDRIRADLIDGARTAAAEELDEARQDADEMEVQITSLESTARVKTEAIEKALEDVRSAVTILEGTLK